MRSEAAGIAAQPGRAVPETLLDALAPQDVLIVLDNCEHLIGACAKTADAILRHCPRVHLVATSREPLGIGGETIYRVPPLSLPPPGGAGTLAPGSSDAVALFVERAKEQGAGLSVDEETGPLVVSICARLDGMPLAIELAAARLRSLSLGALHDRLDQRFRLLTGGSRTALERQQTLEATVDWSYSLLNAPSSCCCGACRSSPRASTLTPPRRCAGSATSTRSMSPAFSVRWSTRASSWPSSPAGPSVTGCWRPSASSPPSGSPRPARTKPPPPRRHTANTSWRSPRRRHLIWPGRTRADGSPGWTPSRPTCGAPPSYAARPVRWDHAGAALWCCAPAVLDGALSQRGSPQPARAGAGAARRPHGAWAIRRGTGHGRDTCAVS